MKKETYRLKIQHEMIRTTMFKEGLRVLLEDTDFTVDISVPLPGYFNDSYSLYGTFINDICITRKEIYSKEKLSAAIVHLSDVRQDDNATQDDTDDSFVDVGVMEFKQNDYAVDQTAKEMIKGAGDILAKGLSEGLVVNYVLVYGLAINYSTLLGYPMLLNADFEQSKMHFYVKSSKVSMYDGVVWLLKAL